MLRQEQLGLSPFGLLSRLFQEELERRVQQNLGAYAPVPLTLLEEPDQEAAAQPVPVSLHLDVHVEAPKLREEKDKTAPKREWDKPAELRILERVQLRERELREIREVLHRLELRLNGQRWNLPQVSRQMEQTAARSHEIGRSTAGTPLPLASQAAAAPGTGGWLPRHQQTHPGYPTQEPRQEGPTGASILLPDVLRRRREAALARTEETALDWSSTPEERRLEGNPTEELLQFVHQAVEQTMRQNRSREQEARQLAERVALERWNPTESGREQRQSDREPVTRQPAQAAEIPQPGRLDSGRDMVPASNHHADDAEGLTPASGRTFAGSVQAVGEETQTAAQKAGMAAVPVERMHVAGLEGTLSQHGSEELVYRQTSEDTETTESAPKRNIPAASTFRGETGGQPMKLPRSVETSSVPLHTGIIVSAPTTPTAAHSETGKTAAPSTVSDATTPSATPAERRGVQRQMDGETPPAIPTQSVAGKTAEHDRSPVQTEQHQGKLEARNDSESFSDETGTVSKLTARPTESTETTPPNEPMVYREDDVPDAVSTARPVESGERASAKERMGYRTAENIPTATVGDQMAVQIIAEEKSKPIEILDGSMSARPTAAAAATTLPKEPMVCREDNAINAALTAHPMKSRETVPAEEPMVHRTVDNVPLTAEASPMTAQPALQQKSENAGTSDVVGTARPAESAQITLPEETIVYREAEIPKESDIAHPVATTEITPLKEPMVYREDDVSHAAVTARPVESGKKAPAEEPMVHRTVDNVPATTEATPTAAQPAQEKRSEYTGVSDVAGTARLAESAHTTLPEETVIYREANIPKESDIAHPAATTETMPLKEPMVYREDDVPDAAVTARPVESGKTAQAEERMVHRTVDNVPATTTQPALEKESGNTSVSDVARTARPAESTQTTLPEETVVYREADLPNASDIARPVVTTEATPSKESMVYRESDVPDAAVTARPVESGETTPAEEPMVHRTMENVPITTAASPTAVQPALEKRSEHTKRPDVVRTVRPAEHTPTAQPEEPIVYRETDAPNQSDTAHPAAATGAAPSGQPVIHRATNGSDAVSKAPSVRNRLTAARPARHAAGSPTEPDIPLGLRQNSSEEFTAAELFHSAGLRDIRTARPTTGQTAAAEMAWRSGTPTLTFAKTDQQQPPKQPEKESAATQNLPAWARELLEKPPAQMAGAAPSGQSRQIQWTAPQAVPVPAARTSPPANAAAVPPSLLHRERGGDDERSSAAQQAEREAEIRRTADKVYRIIEERLRRELRRSGR